MSNGRTIKVGVFGAGKFANNEHLPNLKRIEGVDVVAICDINEAAARQTAAEFGIPHVYINGHEMIDKEEMHAMWSIVPAYTRTDVEATAAAKGIHLFSEKPQAIEMKVARRIDEAVRQELEHRGHRLDIYPDYTRNAAAVEVIVAEPAPGFLRAGADPRQPAYAIVR